MSEAFGATAYFSNDSYFASGEAPFRLYLGYSKDVDIHVFDASGRRIQIIRDATPPDPIEASDIEWERRMLLERRGGEEWKKLADEMPTPDRKPAFEGLIVDSFGNLWVKEYSSYRPETVRYRVYDSDGQRLGTVRLPGRLRVLDIGMDYILGVHYDLDYVETVLVFRLVRPTTK
jgi:hypothetical protein